MEKGGFPAAAACALAIALTCMAVSICWADATSELQRGEALYEAGNYDAAIQVLSGVISDPDVAPEAYRIMGLCYREKEDYPKAIECFETLLANYPNSVSAGKEVKHALAECYLLGEVWDKLMSLSKSLSNEYPEDGALWQLRLGISYQGEKTRHIYAIAACALLSATEALKYYIAFRSCSATNDLLLDSCNWAYDWCMRHAGSPGTPGSPLPPPAPAPQPRPPC